MYFSTAHRSSRQSPPHWRIGRPTLRAAPLPVLRSSPHKDTPYSHTHQEQDLPPPGWLPIAPTNPPLLHYSTPNAHMVAGYAGHTSLKSPGQRQRSMNMHRLTVRCRAGAHALAGTALGSCRLPMFGGGLVRVSSLTALHLLTWLTCVSEAVDSYCLMGGNAGGNATVDPKGASRGSGASAAGLKGTGADCTSVTSGFAALIRRISTRRFCS